MYDELGKEGIPEDHNAAQTPEIAFIQEQGTKELESRTEETSGSSVRWIGHLQSSGGTLATTTTAAGADLLTVYWLTHGSGSISTYTYAHCGRRA